MLPTLRLACHNRLMCVLALVVCLAQSSCAPDGRISMLFQNHARLYRWTNGDRSVVFIPMVHIAKRARFADVRKKIIALQQRGYVVAYELVRPAPGTDSMSKDTLRRKVRRIDGSTSSYGETMDGMHAFGMLKKYVSQPLDYRDLGMDSTGMHADITYQEFIAEFERRHGPVVLDSLDYALPYSDQEAYPKDRAAPHEWTWPIITDFRNQHLARFITTTPVKKLIVVYGGGHHRGTFRILEQEDPAWKKKRLRSKKIAKL